MKQIPASKFWINVTRYNPSVWVIPAIRDVRPLGDHQDTVAYDTALQAERAYVGCEGLALDALIEEGDITMMLKHLVWFIQERYESDVLSLGPTDLECIDILKRILPDETKEIPTSDTIAEEIESETPDGE